MHVEGCLEGVIQGIDPLADDDHNSNNNSLREHVLKIVANKDVRSSRSQREDEEGKDIGGPVKASGEEEAQPAGSSKLTLAPSSSDVIPEVGI